MIWILPDKYNESDKRNWSGLLGRLKLSILLLPDGCMSILGLVTGLTSITSVLVSLIFFSYDKYLEGIRASEPFDILFVFFFFSTAMFFSSPLHTKRKGIKKLSHRSHGAFNIGISGCGVAGCEGSDGTSLFGCTNDRPPPCCNIGFKESKTTPNTNTNPK